MFLLIIITSTPKDNIELTNKLTKTVKCLNLVKKRLMQ